MLFKILAIVSMLSIVGAGWAGYVSGGNVVRVEMSRAIEAERKTQAQKIESLIAFNKVEKVIYRDKIKIVNKTADPTGCINVSVPADILSSVRQYDSISN